MSISTELSRIETARNSIRDKLVELGMASSTDKLEALAEAIATLYDGNEVAY